MNAFAKQGNKQGNNGFSLLEMLVVLSIIVITTAVVAPWIGEAKTRFEWRSTAWTVRSAFSLARIASFTYPEGTIVDFERTANIIRVCADRNNSNSCNAGDVFLKAIPVKSFINLRFNFTDGNFVIFKRGFPKSVTGGFAAGRVRLVNSRTGDVFLIKVARTGRIKMEEQ